MPGSDKIDKLYEHMIERCQSLPKLKVAVAFPCSEDALKGPVEAAELGLIDPVFVGPKHQIEKIAKQNNINISAYEIVHTAESDEAAMVSVQLVNQGKVDSLMKGSLHTDELMREVVKRDTGLRTKRRISHAFIMAIENYSKPFVITDAAINIQPDLMTKRDIIQNAVDLMKSLREDITPKVAILSAVETVNPEIPSTLDAACLCKMAERGQIEGAIVDGPFAYDNVLSIKAAETKHIKSPVIGDVDIFLVPNLEAGNMIAKQLTIVTNAISAGIILGAKVPIILTSRSDGVISRISSCAIAMMMVADAKRKKLAEME